MGLGKKKESLKNKKKEKTNLKLQRNYQRSKNSKTQGETNSVHRNKGNWSNLGAHTITPKSPGPNNKQKKKERKGG